MKLTDHFTKEEMERSNTATRLGLPNSCPVELMPNMFKVATRMELVRKHFNVPVSVLSCYRSSVVNAAVGGSSTSAHRFASAIDFTVQGVSVKEVCQWCAKNITDYDQILYEFGEQGWTHMGFSDKPRKQLLTATKVGSKTVYESGI